MADSNLIPSVQVHSGQKFVTDRGITAIKDGIKASSQQGERLAKPDWLRIRARGGPVFDRVKGIVHEQRRVNPGGRRRHPARPGPGARLD